MFQLNRRGYKKNNYENARMGLTVLFVAFFLSLTNLIHPILRCFLFVDVSKTIWNVTSILAAVILTFYLTRKYYGPNGSRTWVVKYYDKNTNIRKQNSILQSIFLAILLVGFLISCKVIGFRLEEYLVTN